MATGKLFLIPTPLGEESYTTLPHFVLENVKNLRYFVVERAKTARQFLKSVQMPVPLQDLNVEELNEHTAEKDILALLAPVLAGHDLGLMSEAGCPAVADPGAMLVRLAHQKGVQVVPYVGPSSILLALMGSGLHGQSFAFVGYLPVTPPERKKMLQNLERNAKNYHQTQLFIETPYRNNAMLADLLATLSPQTMLCVASQLTTAEEFIKTKTIAEWKRAELPDLNKKPTIFLFL